MARDRRRKVTIHISSNKTSKNGLMSPGLTTDTLKPIAGIISIKDGTPRNLLLSVNRESGHEAQQFRMILYKRPSRYDFSF